MALIPDRTALQSLRRADLQKLCKDHGLKANMKSEQLIELLLDTAQANPQIARRSASVRVASRDSTSSDTRGRVGSMIIHDLSEDEGDDVMHEGGEKGEPSNAANGGLAPAGTTGPSPPSGPATRTRKAKETLYKLGVGRPKALGGSGPRKLSRGPPSSFIPRSKRVKTSVSVQPSQQTIQEEEEEATGAPRMTADEPVSEAGPSGTRHDSTPSQATPVSQEPHNNTTLFHTMITEAVDPLRTELDKLRSELQRLTSLTTNFDGLKTTVTQLASEVAALRLRSSETEDLAQEVKSLKDEVTTLKTLHVKGGSHLRTESAGKATDNSVTHTAVGSSSPVGSVRGGSPSFPTISLGKRQRESAYSNDGGQGSALSEEEVAKEIARPTRKRLKLTERASSETSSSHATEIVVADTELVEDDEELPQQPPAPRPARFTIFSGPEEPPDDGPPTTRLPDLFGHTAVTPPNGQVSTATAAASENQPPTTGGAFNFNFATSIFAPATSTPTVTSGIPATLEYSAFPMSIPAPEPPLSPTPVGPAGAGRLTVAPGTRPPRPSSAASRPASRAAQRQAQQPTAGLANAAGATLRTLALPSIAESSPSDSQGQPRAAHVNPAHMGLGMSMGLPGYVPLPMAPDTPAPPTKRTMYGTELETDTRFGDFGVEGVATGFWTGAAPRY